MHCEKQAKEKKLTGDEKDKFVKECSAGNKANYDVSSAAPGAMRRYPIRWRLN